MRLVDSDSTIRDNDKDGDEEGNASADDDEPQHSNEESAAVRLASARQTYTESRATLAKLEVAVESAREGQNRLIMNLFKVPCM